MKLLYLCQRIPYPPDRGDRIPVFHQIKHLRQKHEVVVGSLAHPGTRSNANTLGKELGIKVIAPHHSTLRRTREMLFSFMHGKPLSLGYFRNPALQSQIDLGLSKEKFDAIIAFSSSMAQYVEQYKHVPRIMHFCDVDSQKWESMAKSSHGLKRWIFGRESKILLEYERRIAGEFDASCVVSQNEAALFRKHIPGIPVHVIENGVDVEYFAAVPRQAEGVRIIFVGVMDYAPNVDAVSFFVSQVWERVRSVHPHARFIIVGSRPSKKVRDLAQIPGVEVTGYVPDIRSYLASATLSIAPLAIARGVQNKILEAMAAGVPVLTTPGVAKGLPAEADRHVFTAEREAEAFSSALLELLKHGSARDEKAREAQKFVQQNCTWEAKLHALDDLLVSCV
jgi:sugar transferase (PEP-CTERM/EpsH1 system associated)